MDSLMKSIHRIHRCNHKYFGEKLKTYGVASHQQMYIVRICRHPGVPQERLTKHVAVNKSNVTRQLASLEQHGFITRQPSKEDKRSILVYPTPKALEVYPIIVALREQWNDFLLEDFNDEERELLLKMLAKVQCKAMQFVGEEEVER